MNVNKMNFFVMIEQIKYQNQQLLQNVKYMHSILSKILDVDKNVIKYKQPLSVFNKITLHLPKLDKYLRYTYKKSLFTIMLSFYFVSYPNIVNANPIGSQNNGQSDTNLSNTASNVKKTDSQPIINKEEQRDIGLFFLQVGMGFTSTRGIAKIDSTLLSQTLPTFHAAFGFNEQVRIYDYIFVGLKLQINYEVSLTTFGENTMVYQDTSAYIKPYIGYSRFFIHFGLGYEMLNYGQTFSLSNNQTWRYGMGLDYGFAVVFTKHNAVEFSIRHSKAFNNAARFLLNYEYRF